MYFYLAFNIFITICCNSKVRWLIYFVVSCGQRRNGGNKWPSRFNFCNHNERWQRKAKSL